MVDSEDTEARVDAQAAVDALFGAGRARVVDAVSSTRVTEREVLLVNGVAVRLVGDDGAALKDALLAGRLPDEGLLGRVLASVLGGTGAWRGASGGGTPSTLTMHSSLSLTSSVTTSDTVTLCHNGRVIDSRSVNSTRHAQVSGATTTHTQALPPNCPSIFAQTSASAEEPPSSTSSSTSTTHSSTGAPVSTCATTTTTTSTSTSTSTSTPSGAPNHTSTTPESTTTTPHAPSPTPAADAVDGVKSGTGGGTTTSPKWCGVGVGGAWACEDSGGVQYRSYSGRTAMNSDLVEALARTGLVDLRPQPSSPPKASPAQQQRPTIFGTLADGGKGTTRDHKVGLPQGARTRSSHEHDTPDGEHQSAPDHEHALVYEDGVLVAGSLQALVQHAVPTGTYYPDTAYLFAFLLSARLFIKPHELLQQICAVGFAQQGITNSHDAPNMKNEQLSNFVRHMVQLLAEWSETFPYDFRDDRLMAGVRSLTHRCIALRPDLRRDVTQVLHNLLNKLTHLERFEESAAKLTAPPPADLIPQPSDISEICASPLVMAQQLTHIELERLSFIGPEEFVQAFAKDNLDTSYKDLKRTCNLEAYIQWFNRLSYLVATHACSHVKRKVRVRLIEWWVEVARECFNIGNFNSLMGVIAGLNMAPVSRMKKTWSKVQSAKFSVLEHQMDPSSNFSSYRSTLKAAMWRSAGALDDRQKIVIPFFSLLVKDLYFLNEGCANRLPNGHINFDKFWQLAKQVTEFLAWKQVSCPFTRHPEVITYLLTTQILSETGLALASFECESPENHYEKERYKALKSALNPTT